MSYSRSLIDNAKQGDAKAIASLLNNYLHPKGIRIIKSAVKKECLHLMLEAVRFPSQEKLVNFTKSFFLKLQITSVQSVKLYGCHQGEDHPSWDVSFELNQNTENTNAAPKPKNLEELIQESLGNDSSVKIRKRENMLVISLKSGDDLEEEATCNIIRNKIKDFGIDKDIEVIRVYFQKNDEDFPDWHHEYSIGDFRDQMHDSHEVSTEEVVTSNSHVVEIESTKIKQLSYDLFEELHRSFLQPIAIRLQFMCDVDEDPNITPDDTVRGMNFESLASELRESTMQASQTLKKILNKYALSYESIDQEVKFLFSSIVSSLHEEIKQDITKILEIGNRYLAIHNDDLDGFKQALKGARQGFLGSVSILGGIAGAVQGFDSANHKRQELKAIEQDYIQAREMLFEKVFSCWRQLYLGVYDLLEKTLKIKLVGYQEIREKVELYEEDFEKAIDFLLDSNDGIKAVQLLESARDIFVSKEFPLFPDRILQNLHGNDVVQSRCFIWGDAYLKTRDTSKARYFYEFARDHFTNLANANFRLACVSSLEGNIEKSLEFLQLAIANGCKDIALIDSEESLIALREDSVYAKFFDGICKTISSSNIDYRKLVMFLSESKWKESDVETYHLIYESIGKKATQDVEPKFSDEDILKIPLDDLKNIDYFWVKYSSGKYGFSIQNKIYQENINPNPSILVDEYFGWSNLPSYQELFKKIAAKDAEYDKQGILPYLVHTKGNGWLNSLIFETLLARLVE